MKIWFLSIKVNPNGIPSKVTCVVGRLSEYTDPSEVEMRGPSRG